MALSYSKVIDEDQNVASSTSFTTTATPTPGANKGQVVAVITNTAKTTGGSIAPATPNGCTYVSVSPGYWLENGLTARNIELFRALCTGTPAASALTYTRGGADVFNRCTITAIEVTGCDTSGTNGSGFCKNLTTGFNEVANTLFTASFTMTTGTGALAFWGVWSTGFTTATPKSGWVEQTDKTPGNNYLWDIHSLIGTDTSSQITYSGSTNFISWGVLELVAAGAAGAVPPLAMHEARQRRGHHTFAPRIPFGRRMQYDPTSGLVVPVGPFIEPARRAA